MEISKSKIKRHKKIWLTKESYEYLRQLKRKSIEDKRGKSMTEILDIIINNYKKNGETNT